MERAAEALFTFVLEGDRRDISNHIDPSRLVPGDEEVSYEIQFGRLED